MPISPEQLAALMQEVEESDPIDFADLPFPEEELRALVANHLCEMAAAMENFSNEDRLMTLLAVSAKLVLENLVLHVQLLRRHGLAPGDDVEALLGRLRKPGS
jgi:predicted Mrr-cat superfamily restriction endonuclease